MSNSYRHFSIMGNSGAESEKTDKRICNKKLRRRAKLLLAKYGEDFMEPLADEIMDKWSMAKDGKQFFDIKKFPRFMRK